jgi:hypothetical protein
LHAVVYVSYSYLSLSLSPNIFALCSPARACTRSHTAKAANTRQNVNARFPRVFFWNEALNAVLLLGELHELSDQLDVTLESSKRVKQALTWVATTQSNAIK